MLGLAYSDATERIIQAALSERPALALGHVMEQGSLTIQDYEHLCPGVNRRSLHRDLKAMLDKGLLDSEGATNRLIYRLKETEQ